MQQREIPVDRIFFEKLGLEETSQIIQVFRTSLADRFDLVATLES